MNVTLLSDERLDIINDNLKLIQKKSGLTFGTDSYLLAAFAKSRTKDMAADLGSGTGVAALLCAKRNKYRHIHAFEIQTVFCELIKRNISLNRLDDKISVTEGDIRESLAQFDSGKFGCVISNPPYMSKGCGAAPVNDEMNIARREENGTIYDFAKAASHLLKHGGIFTTVYRPDRSAELIHALKENSLEPKRIVYVYPDLSNPPCLMLTEAKKGAMPSVKISRPLIIYANSDNKNNRQYTEDMNRVYDEFSLDFLF